MQKYFRLSAVRPLILIAAIGLVLCVTHDGSKYKSDFFTDDGFVLTVLLSTALSCILLVLSTTIFLNKLEKVRESPFYSVLSWFLLPASLGCYILYLEISNFVQLDGYEGNRLLDAYISAIPIIHGLFLTMGFMRYRKDGRRPIEHSGQQGLLR
jgi:heme/copper-type cytochrome/quinol oxidase subunit 3